MYTNFTVLAASTLIPEGGVITFVQYCTCSAAILVHNYDYVTLSDVPVAYIPGVSTLYQNFNIYTSGTYNLSQYIPTTYECLEYDGESCTVIGTAYGIWYHLGTS